MNLKKLITFLFVAAFAFSGNIVRAHDGDEGEETVHEETLDSVDGQEAHAGHEDGAEDKAVHKAEKKGHKGHAKKSAKKKMAKKKAKKKSHS